MTTATNEYEQGYDAARRALDHTTMEALELYAVARQMERFYRMKEIHNLAERCKGFADHVQEFLDDKAS